MSNLKPIIHGSVDPTEIPYYCRQCIHYHSEGAKFPWCDRREDGKFRAEIAFTCFKRKPAKDETKEQPPEGK